MSFYDDFSYEQLRDLNVFLVRMEERTMHLHHDMEIGIVLEGTALIEVSGMQHRLWRGDLYLINGNMTKLRDAGLFANKKGDGDET